MNKWKGGGQPYGYQYDSINSKLLISPTEHKVLQNIFYWTVKGLGVSKIAYELNSHSILPRRGKHWTGTTISYILSPDRLKFYAGFDSEGKKADWDPLLTENQFEFLLKQKEERVNKNRKLDRPERVRYLLSGLGILKCGCCGGSVKASVTKQKEKKVLYYYCTNRQTSGQSSCNESVLHRQEKIDNLVLDDLELKTSSEYFSNISNNLDLFRSNHIHELENIFSKISSVFYEKIKIVPNDALKILENGLIYLKSKNEIANGMKMPVSFNENSLQETLLENIEEIILFKNYLEIRYKFPINDYNNFYSRLNFAD